MKRRLFGRRFAVLAGAVMVLSSGITVASTSVQASTARNSPYHVVVVKGFTAAQSPAIPDFTCPSPSVCVFQGTDFNGYVYSFPTRNFGSSYKSLTSSPYNFSLPWGSFNNNSGSSVAFYDLQINLGWCFGAHAKLDASQLDAIGAVRNARYIYIEYGVTNCTGKLPPPP